MFRSHFNAIVVLTGLCACASEAPARPDEPVRNRDRQELAGGNSGTEGSIAPCVETATPLASVDATGQAVEFSGADLLALANREPEVAVSWPARDSGPDLVATATRLHVNVTAHGEPTEYVCGDPAFPAKYRPKPRLEVPVTVSLRTDDGVLDARFETTLSGETLEHAKVETLTLEAAAVGGELGASVASFYPESDLVIEVFFGPDGTYGWVGGPFSPNTTRPCAYTAYAVWPATAACWPEREGSPLEDDDAMRPHLARLNQTFDLKWNDGTQTRVRFDATLSDGATCDSNGQISRRVQLHITSEDGRVDLTLPAMLSGGPQTIDPWPAHLRDVEPFSLNMLGSIALDAAALEEQLNVSIPGVSAAIASVYLSSPVGVNSPELGGGFRVVPIDRTGFTDPLPTVELPGGDSEHCFSATPRAKVMSAEISLR